MKFTVIWNIFAMRHTEFVCVMPNLLLVTICGKLKRRRLWPVLTNSVLSMGLNIIRTVLSKVEPLTDRAVRASKGWV
jgi:hypothetical protein